MTTRASSTGASERALVGKNPLSRAHACQPAANAKERASNTKGSIFFVIGTLEVGGTELHVTRLACALVQRGWAVTVYCLLLGGPLQPELEAGGVRVIGNFRIGRASLPSRVYCAGLALIDLHRKLRVDRFDVVHFFLPSAYLLGGTAAVLARAPKRVMSRRSLNAYQQAQSLKRIFELVMHRQMTAILGNSRCILHELETLEGVPAEKLGLIYNGLAIDLMAVCPRAEARVRNGFVEEDFIISIVANLIPYKGHSDLLQALARVSQNLPRSWKLLVIGRDDGLGSELHAQALSLGIADHVSFLGLRKNVLELLAASDMGVLCSHEEGFSNALLEGMAAGLPMVVTSVGGNPEAVEDGTSGTVVPPRDPKALGDAIVDLAADPERRVRYGAAAKARVMKTFTFERCVGQYEALYASLLTRGKVPREISVSHASDGTSGSNSPGVIY